MWKLFKKSKYTLSLIHIFYEILLKRYKIVPEQALFFDDRPENVEGARKVGINGVVFNTDIPLQMLEK